MSYLDLKSKVFVVTGAAAGIGREVALNLARNGSRVGLVDLRKPDETLQEVEKLGGEGLSIQCDVKDSAALDKAIWTVTEQWGRLDGAANMAGFLGVHPLDTVTDAQWNHLLGVNLNGVKNSVISELRHMKGSGSIVNASSVAGQQGNPTFSSYSASKWGLNGFTKSAAQEVGNRNIRVNAVAPYVAL